MVSLPSGKITVKYHAGGEGKVLSKVNLKSLFIRRLQNFMIMLYKSLFFMNNYPCCLKDMFTVVSLPSGKITVKYHAGGKAKY